MDVDGVDDAKATERYLELVPPNDPEVSDIRIRGFAIRDRCQPYLPATRYQIVKRSAYAKHLVIGVGRHDQHQVADARLPVRYGRLVDG